MTALRFAVDGWDPRYGPANDLDTDDETDADVVLDTELPLAAWTPLAPSPRAVAPIAFVDGVRRIDAHLWIALGDGDSASVAAVCGSWGAGAVICRDDVAAIRPEFVTIGRTVAAGTDLHGLDELVTSHGTYRFARAKGDDPVQLWLAVQEAMNAAEVSLAGRLGAAEPDLLVVVDGPLRGRDQLEGLVGLVKTHRRPYLEGPAARVAGQLRPGERTPVFSIVGAYPRHSWYVRLPGEVASGVPLGATVRLEAAHRLDADAAVELADLVTAALPRFASAAHKDRRAPQNLTPIAGLERLLRHRLGDPAVLHRALLRAAHHP